MYTCTHVHVYVYITDEITRGIFTSGKIGVFLEVWKEMFLNTRSISKVNTVLKARNENVGIKQIGVKRNPHAK